MSCPNSKSNKLRNISTNVILVQGQLLKILSPNLNEHGCRESELKDE